MEALFQHLGYQLAQQIPKEYLVFFFLALLIGFTSTVFRWFYWFIFRVAVVFGTFLAVWHKELVAAWLEQKFSALHAAFPAQK